MFCFFEKIELCRKKSYNMSKGSIPAKIGMLSERLLFFAIDREGGKMAQKDIAEKLLCEYNDVFTDIINGLVYDGEKVVCEADLEGTGTKAHYKADDQKLHEQGRDVVKYWKKHDICFALCGIENQTVVDADMPFRIIGYDGASYRSQMLNGNTKRFPVVTIVLYFGLERWNKPKSLKEIFSGTDAVIPEKFIQDYKAFVYEVAYFTDDQINKFTSDFKEIAKFFVDMRKTKENKEMYIPDKMTVCHVDAFLKFLGVFSNMRWIAENKDDLIKTGGNNMTDGKVDIKQIVYEAIKNESTEAAVKKAAKEAAEKAAKDEKITVLLDLVQKSTITAKVAAQELNVTEEEIKEMLQNQEICHE